MVNEKSMYILEDGTGALYKVRYNVGINLMSLLPDEWFYIPEEDWYCIPYKTFADMEEAMKPLYPYVWYNRIVG